MVLVFKTSVVCKTEVELLRPELNRLLYDNGRWNFDLDDCDHILRIETIALHNDAFISLLNQHGFLCEELGDDVEVSSIK